MKFLFLGKFKLAKELVSVHLQIVGARMNYHLRTIRKNPLEGLNSAFKSKKLILFQ